MCVCVRVCVCRWLTFIRGVVDSEDLPLNVGREILQKSKMLTIINKRITNKAIDMIRKIRDKGGDQWNKFWENFGKYLKVRCAALSVGRHAAWSVCVCVCVSGGCG